MSDASDIFGRAFGRSIGLLNRIAAFRQTAGNAVFANRDLILQRNLTFVENHVIGEGLITGGRSAIEKEGMTAKNIAEKLTIKSLEDDKSYINAASIVFAHSVFDVTVNNYLEVASLMNPKEWLDVIARQDVKLSEVLESSIEEILKSKLSQCVKEISKKSLPNRIDILLRHCPPKKDNGPIKDYKYDRDIVEEFDKKRHNIVHALKSDSPKKTDDELLSYIIDTANFLGICVAQKFSWKFDPKFLLESEWQQKKEQI